MLAASIDSLVVPSTGLEGQTIALSAQASTDVSGASLNYQWLFGDGASQSGVNLTDVTHAYAAPATPGTPYIVTLTVDDGSGPVSATSAINISDVPPTVNAGPSQTLRAGDTAQFNGSVSDPGGPGDIASIQWDFNYNGSIFNADTSANGNLTPSYTYSTPGTYLVAMQATDQGGNVSQDITTVTVKPADALMVNAGADVTVTVGQSVTFSGSYSDPNPDEAVYPYEIAWDFNYNPGAFLQSSNGTLTPTTTFNMPGTYQVALQITANNDVTGNTLISTDLSVLNVTVLPISYTGPTAAAGPDRAINEGDTASFNGSYTDPDGTVSSSNIAWDFNYDGVTFNPMATGTLTPTYQYTTPGTYQAALQVTDSNGLTSLSTLNLTVNAVTPAVSAGSVMTVAAGQLVQFAGSANLPSGATDPLTYAWDFDYDGQNFNPGSANTLTPYQVFATPGTYTVALQATDSVGVSGLSTITVTVNPSTSLVVNAGPDQALDEGDTASFAGSYTDAGGTVDPSRAQWDFNYTGSDFSADPSASGTLTPSHQFTTPGNYLVALQLTDSNLAMSIGTMYVSVADVPPVVDAGPDRTVNQGSLASFNGTASQLGNPFNLLSYAWDFDYDGQNFVADPLANGTLTPSHIFYVPGTYEVALQVSDGYGGVSLATQTVTVNDVPPTATVSNSGPVPEGSAVTFILSNLQDSTPGDTPTILADWTGSGQFEQITPDELTTNLDGSLSFNHTYDDAGNYNADVRLLDGNGGYTDYTQNVVVNEAAPSAVFGPAAGATIIDATTPILFSNVLSPSLDVTQAGFTYFVSLDGGAYTSSTSPIYDLPSGISLGSHTLTGYVQDSEGQTSPVYTSSVNVVPPQVTVSDTGIYTGPIQLNWTGGSEVVQPNTTYTIDGLASNLTITLLASPGNDDYTIQTNGTIARVDDTSAPDATFSISTQLMGGVVVGDGSIGEIDLAAGSRLSVDDRGDLGSIVGPSSGGEIVGTYGTNLDYTAAVDLVFANLTGSITGVDEIDSISASGWLGTSASQLVQVAAGIGSLSAYGVGATVQPDIRQDAADEAMQVDVGDGGVPGEIDGGNVGNVSISGDVSASETRFGLAR